MAGFCTGTPLCAGNKQKPPNSGGFCLFYIWFSLTLVMALRDITAAKKRHSRFLTPVPIFKERSGENGPLPDSLRLALPSALLISRLGGSGYAGRHNFYYLAARRLAPGTCATGSSRAACSFNRASAWGSGPGAFLG